MRVGEKSYLTGPVTSQPATGVAAVPRSQLTQTIQGTIIFHSTDDPPSTSAPSPLPQVISIV